MSASRSRPIGLLLLTVAFAVAVLASFGVSAWVLLAEEEAPVAAPPPDAGTDAGPDAGSDAGVDAGSDAGVDAGPDAGVDAGPIRRGRRRRQRRLIPTVRPL